MGPNIPLAEEAASTAEDDDVPRGEIVGVHLDVEEPPPYVGARVLCADMAVQLDRRIDVAVPDGVDGVRVPWIGVLHAAPVEAARQDVPVGAVQLGASRLADRDHLAEDGRRRGIALELRQGFVHALRSWLPSSSRSRRAASSSSGVGGDGSTS